jgi:hypothetical protein
MNVRATEMCCSGQRSIPILRSSWSKLHRMRWCGRVWHQITWLDLTSRWTRENGIVFGNFERMAQTSAQKQRNLTVGHTYTSLFLCAKFWTYLFPGRCFGRGWPTSLAPLTWPPHSPDLTTPNNSLWGSIKRSVPLPHFTTNEEWHRAAEGIFRTNAPKLITEDMEAHPLVCPVSGCTYGSTGHVTKK